MAFAGFGEQGQELLARLGRQQEREWLRARREDFERELRGPARELVEELRPALMDWSEHFVPERAQRAVPPLYRDARFARAGAPFHDGLLIRCAHRHVTGREAPAFALRIGAEGYRLRIGLTSARADTMQRLRGVLRARSGEWRRIVGRAGLRRRFGAVRGPVLTKPPRGCEEDAARLPELLLRAMWLEAEGAWEELRRSALKRRLVQDLRLSADFMAFVCSGLGLPFASKVIAGGATRRDGAAAG